jgi:hypothetical protein
MLRRSVQQRQSALSQAGNDQVQRFLGRSRLRCSGLEEGPPFDFAIALLIMQPVF